LRCASVARLHQPLADCINRRARSLTQSRVGLARGASRWRPLAEDTTPCELGCCVTELTARHDPRAARYVRALTLARSRVVASVT
jgi:hypothetical protein